MVCSFLLHTIFCYTTSNKIRVSPRMAKVISRMVWHFRAWRKLFPEWFGISARGESHFPNGLMFPRSAKVISQMVWHFRAWRKSFLEWFGVSAHGESRFPNGLMLAGLPQNSGASGRRQCCEMQDDGTSTHSN